jgi:virulence-associated protein VapD
MISSKYIYYKLNLDFLEDYKKKEHYTKSYSQLNQDTNALEFFNYKKNGFFVEIGANDGITLSNTYLLEKEFGWKGICVEAIPSSAKLKTPEVS